MKLKISMQGDRQLGSYVIIGGRKGTVLSEVPCRVIAAIQHWHDIF